MIKIYVVRYNIGSTVYLKRFTKKKTADEFARITTSLEATAECFTQDVYDGVNEIIGLDKKV